MPPIMPAPMIPWMPEPPAVAGVKGRTGPEAADAARDFESILLLQVVQEMGKTVEESGLLEETGGQQIMDLFYYHLAQEMGRQGGLGLWKSLAAEFEPVPPPAVEVRS